jgi:hypothetical protein
VIYDILFSYYRSAIAREKKKVTQVTVPEKIQRDKVAELV